MSKTKRGHYYKKKKSTRTRYSKNRVIRKKVSNTLIGGGQIEQDAFINSTFEKIKGKLIKELLSVMPQLCLEFKKNIVETEKYEFTVNITSYLVTSMLVPFFMKYEIYTFENCPYSKFDMLWDLHRKNVFLGSVIKQHELTSLTPYPEKSFELLNSCNDDEYYCIMNPYYLIKDYKKVEYYCNSDDPNKIKRITNSQDLSEVENGNYLYCILPNGTLCLFDGHHSAGACGQPVICAGYITIHDKKIKRMDNSSGHYAPPSSMLNTAMDVLKTKGITESYEKEHETRQGGEIIVFELTKSV
jgi:hypothetical protein